MRFCSSCGHELGVGRFCTNCGQPIQPAAPTGQHRARTAQPAAPATPAPATPAPSPPPSADGTPPPPRFPLYADEVDPSDIGRAATADLPAVAAPVQPEAEGTFLQRFQQRGPDLGAGEQELAREEPSQRTPEQALAALNASAGPDYLADDGDEHDDDPERGARRAPRILALFVAAAVAIALVLWWNQRDPGAGQAVDATAAAVDPASLTDAVDVKTPGQAPDSEEVGGESVSFAAENLLDGEPTTAWRVGGSAQGKKLVFTFPAPVTLSQVGLINGYAKISRGNGKRFDWYHGNRTISRVSWSFDDGTSIEQDLERNRRMQTIDVADVSTTKVVLRLEAVSKSGTGRASRDFTAISDVTLTGVPAT